MFRHCLPYHRRKPSPFARALRNPETPFGLRVVPAAKRYRRHPKHRAPKELVIVRWEAGRI